VGVPADVRPEEALADNQKYKVVWQVLQALRAHDDRFNAMINQIDINKQRPGQIQIIGVGENKKDFCYGVFLRISILAGVTGLAPYLLLEVQALSSAKHGKLRSSLNFFASATNYY
jgi:hypothetical protein